MDLDEFAKIAFPTYTSITTLARSGRALVGRQGRLGSRPRIRTAG